MPFLVIFFACALLSIGTNAQENTITTKDTPDYVYADKSGISIETRIVIEKEGEKTKMVFLQETENGFVFKNINWKGDVTLLLDNSESINLEDSDMKGSSLEKGGYVGGFFVPDIYQRSAAYYLSDEECRLLKEHSIILVSYSLDDKYDKDLHYLEISDKTRH